MKPRTTARPFFLSFVYRSFSPIYCAHIQPTYQLPTRTDVQGANSQSPRFGRRRPTPLNWLSIPDFKRIILLFDRECQMGQGYCKWALLKLSIDGEHEIWLFLVIRLPLKVPDYVDHALGRVGLLGQHYLKRRVRNHSGLTIGGRRRCPAGGRHSSRIITCGGGATRLSLLRFLATWTRLVQRSERSRQRVLTSEGTRPGVFWRPFAFLEANLPLASRGGERSMAKLIGTASRALQAGETVALLLPPSDSSAAVVGLDRIQHGGAEFLRTAGDAERCSLERVAVCLVFEASATSAGDVRVDSASPKILPRSQRFRAFDANRRLE